eukprot:CAMPEP_0117448258 /NCGR_PEP_ID=MMETSP0759-20121206/7306_1 /TAXON_ID=63605 /ORGANISM="Percolomonas cosmopolitus, Strain WS" /LENGTH=95 /DNA_ID=CAMNT_0005240635 /DNA_START=335 /DNA_END=623 /DNA_ORIENTATION=-
MVLQDLPYVSSLSSENTDGSSRKIYSKLQLKKKEVDEIMGDEQWEMADVVTNIRCPRCHGKKAYFHMMQTRSSDEPMSQFFKCHAKHCGHFWRVD